MTSANAWWGTLSSWLDVPLIKLGVSSITAGKIIHLFLLVALSVYLAGKIRTLLVRSILIRTELEPGARESIGAIARYATLFLGFILSLQAIGLDLTAFSVVAGAVGIGVGFGLQNIANNFISGLIILIERPIKMGDRIEVGDADGEVIAIGARSTTVLTNDHISIIVPNSALTSNNVTNWKHADSRVRFHIPISVSFDSDVAVVQRLLLEVAAENKDALKDPPPKIWLRKIGDNSLNFELLVWNSNLVDRKGQFISDLNIAVLAKLQQNEVEIPYPKRDVHIRSAAASADTDPNQSGPRGSSA